MASFRCAAVLVGSVNLRAALYEQAGGVGVSTCRSAHQAARLYADGIFLGILEGALTVRCAAQTLTLLERENT